MPVTSNYLEMLINEWKHLTNKLLSSNEGGAKAIN